MIPAPLQNILDRLSVAWHERAVALKAISFALVGVVNSAIDFSVFSASYYYFGLSIIVSPSDRLDGGGERLLRDEFAHHLRGRIRPHARRAHLFQLRAVAVRRLSRQYRHGLVAALFIPVWAGKLLAIGVSFVVNFALSHFVVFRTRR